MKKLLNIIKGWFRFLFTRRTKQAKERLLICVDCKFRKGYFCSICGCELHAKASLETEECPKGFWPGDQYNFTNGGYVPPSK